MFNNVGRLENILTAGRGSLSAIINHDRGQLSFDKISILFRTYSNMDSPPSRKNVRLTLIESRSFEPPLVGEEYYQLENRAKKSYHNARPNRGSGRKRRPPVRGQFCEAGITFCLPAHLRKIGRKGEHISSADERRAEVLTEGIQW
jgi:hypothetical protein